MLIIKFQSEKQLATKLFRQKTNLITFILRTEKRGKMLPGYLKFFWLTAETVWGLGLLRSVGRYFHIILCMHSHLFSIFFSVALHFGSVKERRRRKLNFRLALLRF